MTDWIMRIYVLILAGMSIYGFMGLVTLFFYWRHRNQQFIPAPVAEDAWPTVTIQLPIYNEQFVVERLIDSAVDLDYPRGRLQIQVVDDSDDETTAVAQAIVDAHRANGVDITLVRRADRVGYKAGALQAACANATGEFIAIFDADFAPQPDFLRRTLPHFLDAPTLGVIQTRWTHLNQAQSSLTRAQAIAIDKHFAMEQAARHHANLFPKFNGSGGLWRRACLDDAGGWEVDTVCEDLCLSTRAVLRGWHFILLEDVTAPAELPNTISAFKNQQARWAKGSIQCLLKFFWSIVTAHEHSWIARLYALVAMGGYFNNVLVLVVLALQIPLLALGVQFSPLLWVFTIAGITHPFLFALAQQALYRDWTRRIRDVPTLIVLAIGMTPSQSRAILEVLFGYLPRVNFHHEFVRTPKGSGQNSRYLLPFDWIVLVELSFAIYALATVVLAVSLGRYLQILLPLMSCIGFSYVVWLDLRERFVVFGNKSL